MDTGGQTTQTTVIRVTGTGDVMGCMMTIANTAAWYTYLKVYESRS